MSRNDVILGVAAAVLVVFSLVVSIVIPRRDPGFPGRNMAVFVAVAIALVLAVLVSVELVGEAHSSEEGEGGGESAATETGGGGGGGGGGGQGDAAAGKAVFTANCGGCHTLEEAGTNGTVGPNLDQSTLAFDGVVTQVENGGGGMPPFGGQLSEDDIRNVAAFVVASQG